jgi:putative ABC transport system permease protein
MTVREAVGSWRVALRLARRTAARHRVRSTLVVLLLMVPVFAGSVLTLVWAATYASPEREAAWVMGRADLVLDASGLAQGGLAQGGSAQGGLAQGGLAQVQAALPPGSRSVPRLDGDTIVRTATGGYVSQRFDAVDVSDPMLSGAFLIRAGRAPHGGGEVAVSSALAAAEGLRVGERMSAGMPARTLTVVGLIDNAQQLRQRLLIVPAGYPLSTGARLALLVDLPPGEADWRPPAVNGLGYQRRPIPGPAERAVRTAGVSLVVGFAAAEMGLLVGAAFAVGAMRQRRELAMVGATGATRRQLSRVVLANGALLGACAGILGTGLGLLTFRMTRGPIERIVDHPLADTGVPVARLVGIAALAVLLGLLAALGPARSVARRPIRVGLAGREVTAARGSRSWLVFGVVSAAAGVGIAAYAAGPTVDDVRVATVGAGLVLFGLAAMAPAAVGALGRIAAALPLAGRLALRHAARHRLRTAAAVAAVTAGVAGSVALTLYYSAGSSPAGSNPAGSGAAAGRRVARVGQVVLPEAAAAVLTPDDLRALARGLPTRSVVPMNTAAATALFAPAALAGTAPDHAPPDRPATVGVGGAPLVRAVTGRDPDPSTVDELGRGGAVVFYPEFVDRGTVVLSTPEGKVVRVPAVLMPVPDSYADLPGVVISARTAARLGLPVLPGGLVFDTVRPPTRTEFAAATTTVLAAQLRAAQLRAGPHAPATPVLPVMGEDPERRRPTDPMVYVLAIVSGLVTLVAGGVAVGLATSEMRDDLSTLAAVGAGPGLRRRTAAAQAGLIVGIGAVLGLAGGIVPAAGLVAFRPDLTWQLPWWPLAAAVLGAPLLAVLATAALTRSRLVLVRRPA